MKVVLRFGATAGLLFLLLGGTASAAPGADPGCTPDNEAQITATLNALGDEATFTVQNPPLCHPATIGMAVYLKNADGQVYPQTLSDSATGEITDDPVTLSITRPVDGVFPACFIQIDAFVGPVIDDLSESNLYGPRLLDGRFGQTTNCAEVEGSSTTTTTTTTVPGDTAPPSEPPDEVLGTQVEPLARTGPAVDVLPLLAAAGILMIIGAAAIAGARSQR